MTLRVYTYRGYRAECPPAPNGNKQTREVVAVKSAAAAMRAFGIKRSEWTFSGHETGHAGSIRIAMTKPGVVFWQPLDTRDEDSWTESTEDKS